MRGSVYLAVLLCFVCIISVRGFNLESRIPIIKKGAKGSYFGYSVAEHQEILDDDNPHKSVSW